MSLEAAILIGLSIGIILQGISFHVSLHKLVNKIMAGSYSGYLAAERNIGKKREPSQSGDEGPIEDLSVLS